MTKNNACAQYCIAVIRCLLQEKEIPQMPAAVTLPQLYAFAKMHNVEAMVFHGLEQFDMDDTDPVWQDWRNRADMILTQSIVQLAERDVLFAALPAAGMKLLPVKGCWLKEQYPDIDYRQMSDLDILIPKDKANEAKKIMFSMGYTTGGVDDNPRHTGYLKEPYTSVELHTSLLYEDGGYYDDVWHRAKPVDGCQGLYRFRPEDEYIFYLLHLYKHLKSAGTGIRSVLDSVVYRMTFPQMDYGYIRQELEKWDLLELAANIETLSDCWFCTGAPIPETLEDTAAFILSAGTYGTLENRYRRRLEKLNYENPFLRSIVYWMQRICRPKKEMERSYPILKKLPLLLPIFWIYRAAVRFLRNPQGIRHHIAVVFGKENRHG